MDEENLIELIDREIIRNVSENISDEADLEKEIEMQELSIEKDEVRKDIEDYSESFLSRRSFLKVLGVGSGSLALSSMVSGAWAQYQASSLGVSDTDADTIDGKEASSFGGQDGTNGTPKGYLYIKSGDLYADQYDNTYVTLT